MLVIKQDSGQGAKRKGHILKLNGNKHFNSHLKWHDHPNISWDSFISLNIYINKNYFLPIGMYLNKINSCGFFKLFTED